MKIAMEIAKEYMEKHALYYSTNDLADLIRQAREEMRTECLKVCGYDSELAIKAIENK